MKSFTSTLLLFAWWTLPAVSQHIDTASVTIGEPNLVQVTGYMPLLDLALIEITSVNDMANTQKIDLYFKGCPVNNPVIQFDTLIELNATFPFDLQIYTYHDTSAACAYPEIPILTDSLFLNAQQINSIRDRTGPEGIHIYLDPITDRLLIKGNGEIESIVFHDANGRQVRSTMGPFMEVSIDVSDLMPGVHLVVLRTENGFVTRRFIKE